MVTVYRRKGRNKKEKRLKGGKSESSKRIGIGLSIDAR